LTGESYWFEFLAIEKGLFSIYRSISELLLEILALKFFLAFSFLGMVCAVVASRRSFSDEDV